MLLVAAAPAIWLGLDLVGSGSALESSEIAQTSPLGSAARAANPGITVFSRAADAVLLPILLLALLSVPLAWRRRNAAVLTLAGAALTWIDRRRGHGRGRVHRPPPLPDPRGRADVRARGHRGRLARRRARPSSARRRPRRHRRRPGGVRLLARADRLPPAAPRAAAGGPGQRAGRRRQRGRWRGRRPPDGTAGREPLRPDRARVEARPAARPRDGDVVADEPPRPLASAGGAVPRAGQARRPQARAWRTARGRTIARAGRWQVVRVSGR